MFCFHATFLCHALPYTKRHNGKAAMFHHSFPKCAAERCKRARQSVLTPMDARAGFMIWNAAARQQRAYAKCRRARGEGEWGSEGREEYLLLLPIWRLRLTEITNTHLQCNTYRHMLKQCHNASFISWCHCCRCDNILPAYHTKSSLHLKAMLSLGTKCLVEGVDVCYSVAAVEGCHCWTIKLSQMSSWQSFCHSQDSYTLLPNNVNYQKHKLCESAARHNEKRGISRILQTITKVAVYFLACLAHQTTKLHVVKCAGSVAWCQLSCSPGWTLSSSSRIWMSSLAESLAVLNLLIEVPAIMTHASIPRDICLANGIKDELVRISIGIEDNDDLIADMTKGLMPCNIA